ncbi:hypothetical protein HPB50_011743 [Hyalomma asiaticum]|uniref:Uncharacterized protein n=1 Tax=Hyalomma asiaticum TaxID=266040 RepID=A0ACB7SIT9_HYAAI|nr:hypothetical protein HPB50_011743 [Hyalomma asiaticum]
MMAAAVGAGLILFAASTMLVGAAAENAEEKVTCVHMGPRPSRDGNQNADAAGTATRSCVRNLFNSLQVQLEEGAPVPLPESVPERIKLLAVGCFAVRALNKIPQFGCVPTSSIVQTFECVYEHETDKEELLKAFAAKSKEKYLEIAEKVESCFGNFQATKRKLHPRFDQ